MLRSTTIYIANTGIASGTRHIRSHISSSLGIEIGNIIRWAIVATHQEQSSVIVSYVRK